MKIQIAPVLKNNERLLLLKLVNKEVRRVETSNSPGVKTLTTLYYLREMLSAK